MNDADRREKTMLDLFDWITDFVAGRDDVTADDIRLAIAREFADGPRERDALLAQYRERATDAVAEAQKARKQMDELHACLKEAMEWCKPCNYEHEPWLRWAKSLDSHKPHPSSLRESERQLTEDKVKRLVRRFNRDDKASIAHALMHLETNKIADDDYPGHSGWYCGNREQFVERHKKAVALMRSLLAPNTGNEAR